MANQYDLVRIPGEQRTDLATPVYGPVPLARQPASLSSEFDWKHFVAVLRKHWLFLLLFEATFLAALVGATMLMKDSYAARARIEILPPPVSTVVTLRETGSPAVDEQDYLQTQIE